MNLIIKIVLALLLTLGCIFLASIPELTMYFLWKLVDPTYSWEKLVLVLSFLLGGTGATLLAWLGAFALWVNMFFLLLESKA